MPSLDRVCDYIPGVSTLSNIVDAIFKKKLSGLHQLDIAKSETCVHLQLKSWRRIYYGLLPVIGNIIILLNDLASRMQSKEAALRIVEKDPLQFANLSPHNRDIEEVALTALEAARAKAQKVEDIDCPLHTKKMILELGGERVRHSEKVLLKMAEDVVKEKSDVEHGPRPLFAGIEPVLQRMDPKMAKVFLEATQVKSALEQTLVDLKKFNAKAEGNTVAINSLADLVRTCSAYQNYDAFLPDSYKEKK